MLESEIMFTQRIAGKINIALFHYHCEFISDYRMKKKYINILANVSRHLMITDIRCIKFCLQFISQIMPTLISFINFSEQT